MVDASPVVEARAYPRRVLTDRHDFHQLLLGLDGSVELEVAGHGVRVVAGVLAPIMAGDQHHYLALRGNDCLALDLPVAWCEALELDALITHLPRRLPVTLLARARALPACDATALAGWLSEALGNDAGCVASPRLKMIRLLSIIEADLARPWRVREMAACCHLAEAAFARQFRALTGQAPHAWLIERRLARACRLMVDGRASLTEIALACGFGDAAHFSRAFRGHYGRSPRQWRRAHCKPANASSPAR